jgi:glycosyltransferase involved in cell wall biosynthesis
MKLLILASHPVQYHAPVFRTIAEQIKSQGGECLVVYLSDFSIQGYRDREFGTSFAWDEPLLTGYRSEILNANQTTQPHGFGGLDAPGFGEVLRREQPTRMLVHTLNYRGAVSAVRQARSRGIPCTLRVETNDVAVPRSGVKALMRSLIYRGMYTLFDSAIAIGTYNRQHLERYGIPRDRIGLAYYCVPNRFAAIPPEDKQRQRDDLRQALQLESDRTVLLFSGKLIPKKNPDLILDAIAQLPSDRQRRLAVFFLGSGQLEADLKARANTLPLVPIHCLGFKNQKELPPYYLAADALILPSRQAGETWGLVVNEGLQAGLPSIATEAVGCSADFRDWPLVQIIPTGNAAALAQAIDQLIGVPRQFDRYGDRLAYFSPEFCGRAIADFLVQQSQ